MTSTLYRIQEKVNRSNALVFAVSHSLRYDDSSHRHRPSINATPTQALNLWKACVLPHLLQNLRYLKENQVERLQITLNSVTNSSLKRTLHVYDHTAALCADMGTLDEITLSRLQDLPPQTMERLMKLAQNHLHPQSALNPPKCVFITAGTYDKAASQSGPPGQ
jgi:hypothetical protein